MENVRKYFKRDISWLSFNYRVLMEAMDKTVPLFDRIRFLSIYQSNQEEFYRVRVSEYHQILSDPTQSEEEKEQAECTLESINREVNRQVDIFNKFFFNDIIPELEQEGMVLYHQEKIEDFHRAEVRRFFKEEVFPFLQPVLILKDDIVSFLRDNRLYLAIKMFKKSDRDNPDRIPFYAQIKIPFSKVPRFIKLTPYNGKNYVMFIDDMIALNLDIVFPGFDIDSHYAIRVSRDADFSIEPKEGVNIVDAVRKRVKKRKIGNANRLVYDGSMSRDMLEYICEAYDIPHGQCIRSSRYLNLEDLTKLPNLTGRVLSEALPSPMRLPIFDNAPSMFEVIRHRDFLIHFPYQSFDYLTRFLTEAADNPTVTDIKLTQYRVAENSEVINRLLYAAQRGKQVTVYVEIKARFDEENNIITSELMQQSGVRVVYSTPGLKVHAKALLVKCAPPDPKLPRAYAFLSTGNFNEDTARIYSDMGLFTVNREITRELDKLFSILDGSSTDRDFKTLLVAQFNMVDVLKQKIRFEMEEARQGRKARIILKMNGLHDTGMIDALYDASEAGVRVDLLVRGINCLVPNQPYSRNIHMTRIIDSYLEHARIWYFYAGGREEVYLSSADWMRRNLNRRIETAVPILDQRIKNEILSVIDLQLRDNVKACYIDEYLGNHYVRNEGPKIRSQRLCFRLLEEYSTPDSSTGIPEIFIS
ncbi:polyphosphate kinase [Barnesiella viscericola DSM 18177]|uniref:Polyphosphate kinase n=1 Tax=Barnesiella viscericola DSM 18177 TaxID=880074 RepID=W0EPY3_9BACT|nr:polyphosphate kinase 1 [Barnesiella viscericola]AHF11613.1 polyphosphate kinase [Barnesiella viscericola DSM 18177]